MMSNMILENSHLTTADTRTNIRHTIVVANLGMLVVRISITCLCSVPHNVVGILVITANKCTSTRGSNHLISIEREHTETAKGT